MRDEPEPFDLGGDSGFLAAIPDDEAAVTAPPAGAAHLRPAPPPPAPAGEPHSHGANIPAIETPARRDRIVILGRRASGKTVFLSRLYHHLYRGAEGLTLQARDGPSHLRCINAMEELSRGQWPAATGETTAIDLEIAFPGGTERLVTLDYPGEVFRRAFLDEIGGPEVEALLEHVDRAAAVLLLMDPALTRGGSAGELAEDDFGMIKALQRIRASTDGAGVPVALVLTKVDANAAIIRAAGGLKEFVELHYPALVRAAQGVRVFGCAAVRTSIDPMGRKLPQIRAAPAGIVEPLAWCLASMGRLRRNESDRAQRAAWEREQAQLRALDAEAAVRERRVLLAVWVTVGIVVAIIAVAAWWIIAERGAKP